MNFFKIFLLVLKLNFVFLKSSKHKTNQMLSQSIIDVTQKLFVEDNLQYDILIFGDPSYIIQRLIDEVGNGSEKNYPAKVKNIKVKNLWSKNLTQSSVIFINTVKDALYFLQNAQMKSTFPLKM